MSASRSLHRYLMPILATLLLAAAAGAPGRTGAQEPVTQTLGGEDALGGVDVLVLIDNSGSMYNEYDERMQVKTPGGGSDPHGLRFQAVRHLVTQLTYDNLFEYPGREHRLGVVTFGSGWNTSTDVHLTSLRTNDSAQRIQVEEAISRTIRTEPLGDTDFAAAYARAAQEFAVAPPDNKPRIRAIIMLTDGDPMVSSVTTEAGPVMYWADEDKFQRNPQFVSAYMNMLAKQVGEAFPRATEPHSSEGYHLWVVFLGRNEPYSRSAWERIVGADHWRLVSSDQMIPEVFNDILSQVYDAGLIIPEECCVPPYASQAAFSVFGLTPLRHDNDIVFRRADGSQVFTSDPDVMRYIDYGQGIRRLEMSRPMVGIWHYATRPGIRVKVRFDPVFGKPVLVSPAGAQTQFDEVRVQLALHDHSGRPLQESPGYPLRIEASLTPPDGSDATPLHLSPTGAGGYLAQERVPLDETGTYTLTLAAHAPGCDGKEAPLINPTQHAVLVSPPAGRLLDPVCAGAQCQPFRMATLRFEFVGADGKPFVVPSNRPVRVWLALGTAPPVQMTPTADGRYEHTFYVGGLGTAPDRATVQAVLLRDGREVPLCRVEMPFASLLAPIAATKPVPEEGSQVPANTSVTVGLELRSGDKPFTADAGYPIDWSASYLLSPQGEQKPLAGLGLTPTGRYEAKVTFDQAGVWRVHLAGTVLGPDGVAAPAFAPLQWAVEAIETEPLCLRLLSPTHGSATQHTDWPSFTNAWFRLRAPERALELRIQVAPKSGPQALANALEPGARLADLLAVSLIGPDGHDYGPELTLALDELDPAQVVGRLTSPHPAGAYQLKVYWQDQALDACRMPYVPGAGTGCGTAMVGFDLRASPFHTAATIALGWGLPLALLAVAGWQVLDRSGSMAGTLRLLDVHDPTRTMSIPIAYHRRWRRIPLSGWPNAQGIRGLYITGLGTDRIRVRVLAEPAAEKDLSRTAREMLVANGRVRIVYEPPRPNSPSATPLGRAGARRG
ncbi:MAG: VWA domain-containing protein [Anaerolineae bacterium]